MIAQTPAPAGSAPSKPVAWTEHYRNATISIGRIIDSGGIKSFQVIGTAVIVAPDPRKAFIVTAKHVFDDPQQGWHPSELRVRFAKQENKSFREELGVVLTLTDATGKNLWKSLSDNSDIAALLAPAVFNGLLTDAVGFQDFATTDDVYDGASVFTFGYPADTQALIGPNGLVRAITRAGIIAWTDPNGALDNPLLLDANILPGNSGGPAFKVPIGVNKYGSFEVGGRVSFLGIVTSNLQGFYSVKADGRVVLIKFPDLPLPSVEQVGVVGIGGLGRVEPASKVKALVESLLR
jgi:hypothetical protein